MYTSTLVYAWSTPLVHGIDLTLSGILPNGGNKVYQYSAPTLNVSLINLGDTTLSAKNIPAWFLKCIWQEQGLLLYQSKVLSQLTIAAWSTLIRTISLNDVFTQAIWTKTVNCTVSFPGETNTTNNTSLMSLTVWSGGSNSNFDVAITRAIDPIKNNLDAPELKSGVAGINDFLINKVMNILVPLVILWGILMCMLGFYKIFFQTDDKAVGDGVKLIGFGVAGIIIMMSANFFATTLWGILSNGNLWYGGVQWYDVAQKLYNQILFPFIKIGIYLSLGVLFVMLASRVIGFVFGSDDDTKKKAGTIITWNVLGMLIIIWAKQVVEFVYGKQADVVRSVSNLGEIGSGILATKQFPLLYQIINWAMWLASLLILVMVLFQAFQLLMKPDAPDAMKKIKNSLFYIFIGIIIIWTGYIITNFLIIN